MLYFTNKTECRTDGDLAQLTDATYYFSIYPLSVTGATERNIIYWMTILDPTINFGPSIFIADDKLQFRMKGGLFGGDDGLWSCPITANTYYMVGLKYDFYSDEASNPVIYLNGAKQTVTEDETPSSLVSQQNEPMSIGARPGDNDPFDGYIGEIAIYDTQHADATMETLTKSMIKGFFQQHTTNLIHYWPLDDVKNGSDVQKDIDWILPTSDVAAVFSTVYPASPTTHYTHVDGIDSEYVEATGSDDSEEEIYGFGNMTKHDGNRISKIEVWVNGTSEDGTQIGVAILKDAVWLEPIILGDSDFPSTPATTDKFHYFGDWTQSELDGLQVKLSTPTMDKNESIKIYYVWVFVWQMASNALTDKIGSLDFAGTSADGAGELGMSYPWPLVF